MTYTKDRSREEARHMKTYANGMKATEFSKKQISVIYGKAKNGELKVEKWMMSDMYNLADFYGYDYNANVSRFEQRVKRILEAVFAGDLENAQQLIDDYTAWLFDLLSIKAKKSADRTMVG